MIRSEKRVSPDVSEAYTLPASLYTNPEVLEVEKKEIFSKTWQYVGHISQVQRPGDYFTTEVADEPLIIVHGQDGQIRAFYNVCLHRAGKLEEGAGNKKILTCPYHAWTYHLDGSLNKAPNFKGVQNFEPKDFCLKSVRLEIQASFIFVNLDENALPMSSVFGSLFEGFKNYQFDSLKKARVVENIIHCNWKVTIDNYLECDHCPIVHPGFVSTLDVNDYQIMMYENYSYQGAPLKGGSDQPDELGQGGRYYWLFPNMWFSINPGLPNISINQSIPIDHQTTKLIYTTYLLDENVSEEQEELFKFIDQVREEDFVVCELVQKGLKSRAYTQGRFSLTENLVHHFHLLMQDALEGKWPLPSE